MSDNAEPRNDEEPRPDLVHLMLVMPPEVGDRLIWDIHKLKEEDGNIGAAWINVRHIAGMSTTGDRPLPEGFEVHRRKRRGLWWPWWVPILAVYAAAGYVVSTGGQPWRGVTCAIVWAAWAVGVLPPVRLRRPAGREKWRPWRRVTKEEQ